MIRLGAKYPEGVNLAKEIKLKSTEQKSSPEKQIVQKCIHSILSEYPMLLSSIPPLMHMFR